MEIRPARSEDAGAIDAVARASWSAAYGEFLSAATIDATLAEWYDPAALRDGLDGHPCFFVAVADGGSHGRAGDDDVVGFASAQPDGGDAATLTRVYARPDCWGSGVGSALLARVAETLAPEIERLRAVVLAENEVGRAFYDARGFEVTESRTSELDGETVEEVVVVADAADPFE